MLHFAEVHQFAPEGGECHNWPENRMSNMESKKSPKKLALEMSVHLFLNKPLHFALFVLVTDSQ